MMPEIVVAFLLLCENYVTLKLKYNMHILSVHSYEFWQVVYTPMEHHPSHR